nr:sialate O-acetylesterase [bacterium]
MFHVKRSLWHQGRVIRRNPEAYFKQLTTLVEDLREELSMPELIFIDGQVNGN